jgi:hypothetical protein
VPQPSSLHFRATHTPTSSKGNIDTCSVQFIQIPLFTFRLSGNRYMPEPVPQAALAQEPSSCNAQKPARGFTGCVTVQGAGQHCVPQHRSFIVYWGSRRRQDLCCACGRHPANVRPPPCSHWRACLLFKGTMLHMLGASASWSHAWSACNEAAKLYDELKELMTGWRAAGRPRLAAVRSACTEVCTLIL